MKKIIVTILVGLFLAVLPTEMNAQKGATKRKKRRKRHNQVR